MSENTQPTDAQILDECSHFGFIGDRTQLIKFTRAVLARWGAPQPAAREPLSSERVAQISDEAHREYDRLVGSSECTPRWSAVFAHLIQAEHGIGTKNGGGDAE